MRIQHNIMAMSAYRNYTNNVSAMKKNLEKLSSGYKINRAGDDAAGLAISEKMRAQITGLETAQKNAKDGISLVQTAEGALTEVHDMLNRMVELATMSANGTYDDTTDRAQLQKEMNQLRDEIDRIADSANFNGMKLLNGELDGDFKGGELKVNLNDMKNVDVSNIKDGQLVTKEPAKGKYSIDFSQSSISYVTSTSGATITQNFQIATGTSLTASVTLTANTELKGAALANAVLQGIKDKNGGDAKAQIDGITFNFSVDGDKLVFEMDEIPTKDGFSASALSANFNITGTSTAWNQGAQFQVTPEVEAVSKTGRIYGQAEFTLTAASIKDGSVIKIGDTSYIFAVGKDSKWKGKGANVIDLTDENGTTVDVKKAAMRLAEAAKDNKNFFVGADVNSGKISLTEKEGGVDYSKNNLAGTDGVSKSSLVTTAAFDATSTDWKDLVQFGTASEDLEGATKPAGKSLMLQIGDTADDWNQLKVNIKDMHVASLGIADGDISIADQDSAAKAVDKIKDAINQVSDLRGTLGATQNRLDHTINNLSVMTENIQDAESTIRDVDVAEEMMAYTKNNILIQSAQAMLAQANQVPQGVLQLLQ